jgi:hypothetical protein
MSFYNPKRKNKAELQDARNIIRDVLTGRKQIKRRPTITGMELMTPEEAARQKADDEDKEVITGMVVIGYDAPARTGTRKEPVPVQPITADLKPSNPKQNKSWFKKKKKALPKPEPVAPIAAKKHEYSIDFNTMTPWDEHIELNRTMRKKLML